MNVLLVFYFPVIEVDNWQDKKHFPGVYFSNFFLNSFNQCCNCVSYKPDRLERDLLYEETVFASLKWCLTSWQEQFIFDFCYEKWSLLYEWLYKQANMVLSSCRKVLFFSFLDCCLILNYPFNERLLATNLDSVLSIHNHLDLQFKWSDYVTHKKPLSLEKRVFTSFHKTQCC